MARKIRIDMTGLRYGRLVGIEFSHRQGSHAHWLFACDCGETTIADGTAVRAGKTASCGCLHREICAARLLKHGWRARKRHDPTYRAWQEINTLCSNRSSPRFRDFGARGIKVCPAWASDFEKFVQDMGERPAGTIIARIDAGQDFTPANCRWSTVRSRSLRAIEGARAVSATMRRLAPREPAPRPEVRDGAACPSGQLRDQQRETGVAVAGDLQDVDARLQREIDHFANAGAGRPMTVPDRFE